MSPELITPLITEISIQLARLEIEQEKLMNARAALQEVCKHQFESIGSDHNYQYEKCTICGLTRKS